MTENQEQKLESNGMVSQSDSKESKRPLPEIIIEPLAPPYRVVIPFYYEELRHRFDEYWQKNEKFFLSQLNIKTKKTKGGVPRNAQQMMEKRHKPSKLYGQLLADLIRETLSDEVMFIEGFEIFNFEPDKVTTLISILYFTPELELRESINFACKKPKLLSEEDEWGRKCKELQRQFRTFKTDEDGQVKITSHVLLDLVADVEGKPYEKGSFENQWVDVENIPMVEIKDELLKHKRGDSFKLSFIGTQKDPAVIGKEIHVEVNVKDVHLVEYPEIDDELAKDAEFESLEHFKTKFHEDYEKYVNNALKAYAVDHVLGQIMRNSKVPPVPQEWLKISINNLMNAHLERFKGNEKQAMAATGVSTQVAFKDQFKGQVYRDYMQRLAVRKYGKMYKVEPGGEELFDDILKRVKWTEPENEKS